MAPQPETAAGHGRRLRTFLVLLLASLLHCGYAFDSADNGPAPDAALSFRSEPTDLVVSKNASALLDCAPPAGWSVEWRRDGVLVNLAGDPRRSLLANGSLYFSSVHHTRTERPDEGVYQCVATHPTAGSMVSRWARLQVASLARFDEEPRDVIIRVGDTARFNCYAALPASLASLAPPPSVHVSWLKDDQPLPLDASRMLQLESGALEIDDVGLADQGYYRCNVSNGDKYRLSAEAKLAVLSELEGGNRPEAPTFLAAPRHAATPVGGHATLECAASGNPRPDITWLKDGTTLDLEDLDSRYRRVGSGSLRIDGVTAADAGAYQCRAENSEDSADATATLDVLSPPRFVRPPQSLTAHEKDDAELHCRATGRPQPAIQWTKNGELIIESEYFQIVNGHNLKILGLVASDRGVYQCLASNSVGNIQAAAQLTILPSESEASLTSTSAPWTPGAGGVDLVEPPQTLEPLEPPAETSDASANETTTAAASGGGGQVPSAPRDVEAVIVSSRFVTLRWKEPLHSHGSVVGYSVLYRQDGSDRERTVNTSRAHLEEVNVAGLQPGKTYSMRVVAFNGAGASGPGSRRLTLTTALEPHILAAPAHLHAGAVSPVSLLARWAPPPGAADAAADAAAPTPPVRHYKLFYMEAGSLSEEHEVLTTGTSHLIHGLRPFQDYVVWVVAFNDNGPGASTEEVHVRTWSDVPSDTPQNVAVEAASSTSVIVRWEPPPADQQNGVLTGYKIRYKPKSGGGGRRGGGVATPSGASSTVTTDASRRFVTLTGLHRATEYQVRLSALTVNGSGPMTDWLTAETFENDLDESQVPEPPGSLRARPLTSSIGVSWNPPANADVMVRGYTIGWGKGIPDVYTKLVDGKQRAFVIDRLEPNSEYVISLRAFNQMGDGRPIYETVRTRDESATPEPMAPLMPPVGLKAIVLSSSTVVLYWTDTSLSRHAQTVADARYTVRYTSSHTSSNPRFRYVNSTVLNCMLDDLKPNTQYEFAVKVIKNRRESPWSLMVTNTTFEASPSSPPRDLTVVPLEDNPSAINLNWLPPKQPNGQITGYIIFYTTDGTLRDRDWVVEGVVGDKMTVTIKGLTPDTTYFLKIQARNNKGYGPFSSVIQFRTNPGNGFIFHESASVFKDGRGISSTTLYIILAVAAGIILVLLGVVLVVVFRRRDGLGGGGGGGGGGGSTCSPDRSKKGYIKGNLKGKLAKADNPPDLWIHHDQMEMKGMDKSQRCNSSSTVVSPMARRSQDLDSLDGAVKTNPHHPAHHPHEDASLDRRGAYVTAYAGGLSSSLSSSSSSLRRPIKPKSLLISVATSQPIREPVATATPIPNGSLNQHSDSRPAYPRADGAAPAAAASAAAMAAASSGRAHVTVDAGHHLGEPSPSYSPLPQAPLPQASPLGLASASASASAAAAVASGHPLKSFTVPAPPPLSPPLKMVSPPLSVHRPAPSSPYKVAPPPMTTTTTTTAAAAQSPAVLRAHIGQGGMGHCASPDGSSSRPLQPSYSTEELNQEMANLEGLMKDLNAIASASGDYGC